MATKTDSSTIDRNSALAFGAVAAAGAVAGFAANFVRKAVVQAPTYLAGSWDEALATEHKMTLAIFDTLEKTTEQQTAKRGFLLMQLKHALAKHAMQEENAVYAALRDAGDRETADKLNGDHGYVKQYLYDLDMMPRSDPAWLPKAREFRALIERHAGEEEREVFPALKAKLTEEQNKALTAVMNKEGLKIA
ncbi:hemerythrin domain-containing protein [Sphingomonas jatrophae]|uniref:Hemerythrin HHE cation binding domain-containing protein n=1 Tax=Sphingomonas jatrophae TaxID=1166337 RepID=A0A1I6LKQ0_9SPHN|nr:hemerythrin domain-containing protein [Sphingomonas jatrophae]SFS04036.1 Hemerythrin HHE cation binding domain-containing protein [Sphingomonas jatrophae]